MNLTKQSELFTKSNVETIAVHKRSDTESWGYIKFKQGDISGEQKFNGTSVNDVMAQISEVLINMGI